MSDHSVQEDAFFNSSSSRTPLHSSSPPAQKKRDHDEDDYAIALRMQRQLDVEDEERMREDERMAKSLADEEARGGPQAAAKQPDARVDDDARLAKELHLEEQRRTSSVARGGNGGEGGTATCPGCGKDTAFVSRTMKALGRTYCANGQCFRCCLCAGPIEERTFQVYEGEPVHGRCYREVVVPDCVVCTRKVRSLCGEERAHANVMKQCG